VRPSSIIAGPDERGLHHQNLIKQDRVTEIEDPQERMRAIAKDYCARPGALVICLRNAERVEQNRIIHLALQDAGKISREDYETSIYVTRAV
jgi:hypothetical protein